MASSGSFRRFPALRAQQIMAPCGLADRDALIDRLRRLAQGDDGFYEVERRRKVAHVLEQLRKTRLEQPQLLVEAPVQVMNQEFHDLPPGILIEAGRITVEFEEPRQALENFWPSPWPSATTSTGSSAVRGTAMPRRRKSPAHVEASSAYALIERVYARERSQLLAR